MAIEVIVIDENAVVIKGLRPACECACEANDYSARRRAEAIQRVEESNFFNRAMEEVIGSINSHASWGHHGTVVTGYGTRSSVFRSFNYDDLDIMEEIIVKKILPILKEQGYRCDYKKGSFCTSERYFSIDIEW